MIRRLGIVVLVTALIVSACGRQVTPNRPGEGGGAAGLDSGYMSVKFNVVQPFNFNSYSYEVIFNTAGTGVTPLPAGANTNFAGYSYALIVYGVGGAAQVQAIEYFRPLNSSQAPAIYVLQTTAQQLQLETNSNGIGTQFTIIFQRIIFSGINVGSPSPSPTASIAPTPTPTATASGATAVPTSTATPSYAVNWNFNYFITTPYVPGQSSLTTLLLVDSLGQGGPSDQTYSSPTLDTSTVFDTTFTVIAGNHPPDNGPDDIASGEIANNP